MRFGVAVNSIACWTRLGKITGCCARPFVHAVAVFPLQSWQQPRCNGELVGPTQSAARGCRMQLMEATV